MDLIVAAAESQGRCQSRQVLGRGEPKLEDSQCAAPMKPETEVLIETTSRTEVEESKPDSDNLGSTNIVENNIEEFQYQSSNRIETLPNVHLRGHYWQSPASMVVLYLMGLSTVLGLHFFYSSQSGSVVGNIDQQQRVLRSNNATQTSCLVEKKVRI